MNVFRSLIAFDDLLIDRVTQPVIDWLGRRYGVDQLRLGGTLFAMTLGWLIVDCIITYNKMYRDNAILAVILIVIFVLVGIAFSMIYIMAREEARRANNKTANRNRSLTRVCRLYCSWCSIIAVAFFMLDVGYHLPMAAMLYVLSCDKPPSREQRVERSLLAHASS